MEVGPDSLVQAEIFLVYMELAKLVAVHYRLCKVQETNNHFAVQYFPRSPYQSCTFLSYAYVPDGANRLSRERGGALLRNEKQYISNIYQL